MTALRHLAKLSDGDARKALNSLEIAALTTEPSPDGVVHIDLAAAEQSIQKKAIVYDDEDAHYDTISALSNRCAAAIRTPLCIGSRK